MDKIPELVIPCEERKRRKLQIVDYDAEIKKINDESVATSQRLVLLTEEAKERGVEALAALEDQDEQLDKIEKAMYKISDDMDKPQKFIKRLTEDDIAEEEIEKNTAHVEAALESMKHLAVDIDVQLRIQEPKLNRIHMMIENSDVSMTGANQKMKKLLE